MNWKTVNHFGLSIDSWQVENATIDKIKRLTDNFKRAIRRRYTAYSLPKGTITIEVEMIAREIYMLTAVDAVNTPICRGYFLNGSMKSFRAFDYIDCTDRKLETLTEFGLQCRMIGVLLRWRSGDMSSIIAEGNIRNILEYLKTKITLKTMRSSHGRVSDDRFKQNITDSLRWVFTEFNKVTV